MPARPERRVLVVDDSPAARGLLEDAIVPFGFEVEHAEHGALALHRLNGRSYDAVFLDVNMPVLDGPSLLRVLRARGDRTPVVVVSGGDTRQVTAAVKLGALDYLPKPFAAADVRRVLAKALGVEAEALQAECPRALVAGDGPETAAALRGALPPHVEVDEAPLEEALAAAERAAYRLVLLGASAEPERAARLAARLRARQPEAAVGALVAAGDLPRAVEFPWDLAVERPPSPGTVRGLLVPVALAPLVLHGGAELSLLAHRGPPEREALYFELCARRLRAAVEGSNRLYARLRVDLSRAPARTGPLEALAAGLARMVEAQGSRLELTVPAAVRPALERLELGVELVGA